MVTRGADVVFAWTDVDENGTNVRGAIAKMKDLIGD